MTSDALQSLVVIALAVVVAFTVSTAFGAVAACLGILERDSRRVSGNPEPVSPSED